MQNVLLPLQAFPAPAAIVFNIQHFMHILLVARFQSKSGDYQEVAWTWRLYCAAAIQHLRRVNFSKEGSSSTIASK